MHTVWSHDTEARMFMQHLTTLNNNIMKVSNVQVTHGSASRCALHLARLGGRLEAAAAVSARLPFGLASATALGCALPWGLAPSGMGACSKLAAAASGPSSAALRLSNSTRLTSAIGWPSCAGGFVVHWIIVYDNDAALLLCIALL